jgi:glutamine amidotransferase
MICILDYGVGNLASVRNMFRKLGAVAEISGDPAVVLAAEKLLLPGVGHFDHAMRALEASDARGAIDRFALELRRPVLGICLGAQLLGRRSEEGNRAGLGWLALDCHRFPIAPDLRVPHMGWNTAAPTGVNSWITSTLSVGSRFYFAHSYFMACDSEQDVLGRTTHGSPFASVVGRDNIVGTQFHPEKSLRYGMAVLRAFASL